MITQKRGSTEKGIRGAPKGIPALEFGQRRTHSEIDEERTARTTSSEREEAAQASAGLVIQSFNKHICELVTHKGNECLLFPNTEPSLQIER